ncbi:MAG TPA: Ig-like domain-containing protein [Verrucomicrobiae bacterium]|jgi:hypothetical protein|nr:Ig-like domain-containing protein [Verrucomicrobiae bacterium]
MKLNKSQRLCTQSIWAAVLLLMAAAFQSTHASTIWNGPTTNFASTGAYNANIASTFDLITANVALARGPDGPLFNAKLESSYVASHGSPTNTTWALGSLSNLDTLISDNSFKPWATVIGGGGDGKQLYTFLPGQTYVVHLVSEDIYLSLTFDAWGSQTFTGNRLFSYTRTTAPAASPAPTVSITNPVGGAVFAAPANLSIKATAAVSSGTIANVSFFAGTNLLGSATTAPFGVTAANLAAGAYALTAVATAAGVSTTSSVVNITVVTPVPISNSRSGIVGGLFTFDYTANPGLTYVVEGSSNLVQWVPISTNVASTSPVTFTDSSGLSAQRFYQVVLQPNP